MPLLSAAEIADMRSTQNGTMPDTVVIQRFTTASDGMGGLTETWAAVGTVTGRLSPMSQNQGFGDERITADRVTDREEFVITVPQGSTVYHRDRLVVGSRTFHVELVSEHAAWETALRCYCTEIAGG